jgi:rSAM/selenodomain-associated transferase 1
MPIERLLIFAKRPSAGRVKTRLSPPIPPDEAATLYEAMLRDTVGLAARQRSTAELWYADEPGALEYFTREFPHITLHAQIGDQLGERLSNAFDASFRDGAQRVVIIGSDSPTLPENVLGAPFDDLQESDVAIGPTADGGFYLIGLRAGVWPRARALFDGVVWSSSDALKQTIANAEARGLDLRAMPGWYDVDTLTDLQQALNDHDPTSHLGRWFATANLQRYFARADPTH